MNKTLMMIKEKSYWICAFLADLEQLVTEISVLYGKIRVAQLRAHLAERAVLTADQLMRYDTLRRHQQPGSHGQLYGH